MNFKDLQISFDALLIAAIEDTSNESLTLFTDFFKKEAFDRKRGFSQEDLDCEEKKLISIILQCRKIAMDLKLYWEGDKVLTEERMKKLQMISEDMQTLGAFGIGARWVLEKYLGYTAEGKLDLLMINSRLKSKRKKRLKLSRRKTSDLEKEVRLLKASRQPYKVERVPISDDRGNIDNSLLQRKRRYDTGHTTRSHLKKLWGIEIGTRKRQYEILCDFYESIIYRPQSKKSVGNETSEVKRVDENGKEVKEKEKRIEYRIRLFSMLKNRNKLPLDLFDGTWGPVIFDRSYRYIMSEFVQELMRVAEKNTVNTYMGLKEFWLKWHSDFVNELYDVALSGQPAENISAFYQIIWSSEPKDELTKTVFCGSLFSEVLFHLLKEEIELKLYQFQYVVEHSQIEMETLNEEQRKVFASLMDKIKPLTKASYDDFEKIINQHQREVRILLGVNSSVSKLFLKAKKLLQCIVYPNEETVAFWELIAMMQCCATSIGSKIKITRYGMVRGEKTAKLSTIIRRPANNDGKETRLFLVHLMRRRYFMNLLARETVDQIDKYRLTCEESISNCLSVTGDWGEIQGCLAELSMDYDFFSKVAKIKLGITPKIQGE